MIGIGGAATRRPLTHAAIDIVQKAKRRQRTISPERAELLPVPYYHVVFTLPAPTADIGYTNKAVIYDALFKPASETTLRITVDS
jgi:hypothetical protein